MKSVTLACLIFLFCSCSKDSADPNTIPDPPIKPDTLGVGWTKVVISKRSFGEIAFQNNNVGYVGAYGLWRTTNGGLTWDSVNNTSGYFTVTPNGTIQVATVTDILKSVDGGKILQPVYKPDEACDIYFTGNDSGYATTKSGLIRTVDGGQSWFKVAPAAGLPALSGYSSVFFLNAASGWVSTGNDVYKTAGDINHWEKCQLEGGVAGTVNSIAIFATSTKVVYLSKDNGEIYKSTDGGARFKLIQTFPLPRIPFAFVDIHFVGDSIGFVGCGKKIYKTTDAGNSWQTVVALGEDAVIEIHFNDATHGWACGSSGMVLVYKQ